MSFVNLYKPPVVKFEAEEPYDVNFCLPVPAELSTDRVKLVPFIPSLHADQQLIAVSDHPELYRFLPYGPFHISDPDTYYAWYADRIQSDTGTVLFAIIDKTASSPKSHPNQGGALAGVLSYCFTSAPDLRTEIGHVIVFPKWQRTFLTTNAVGLLLIHALDTPNKGGLGLRRVQWRTYEQNTPSVNAALRLGMRLEAIDRWYLLMPALSRGLPKVPGDSVRGRRVGDPAEDQPGIHWAELAMCWDHYDRDVLQKMMTRKE